jgi:two-component system, NtrC family, sensor kinase
VKPPASTGIGDAVNSAKLATLGMLVAGVAHEVNTPLGALASNHDVIKRAIGKLQVILADDVVDETELAEVRRIVRALDGILKVNDLAVARVLELVGSLRSFGRLDRSETDRLDLHEGIDNALVLLRHRMERRIRIEKDYAELPPVECFPQQLNQVFMNLLLNAIQAIEGEGTITIVTALEGGGADRGDGADGGDRDDGVRIEIRDTGRGIPPELLETIFEPGFTTKGSRVGMGLGLLISRQIVDRHGGRISVRSEPGQGSTFTVTLPVELDTGGTPRDAAS